MHVGECIVLTEAWENKCMMHIARQRSLPLYGLLLFRYSTQVTPTLILSVDETTLSTDACLSTPTNRLLISTISSEVILRKISLAYTLQQTRPKRRLIACAHCDKIVLIAKRVLKNYLHALFCSRLCKHRRKGALAQLTSRAPTSQLFSLVAFCIYALSLRVFV